jgi:hypothetical protein
VPGRTVREFIRNEGTCGCAGVPVCAYMHQRVCYILSGAERVQRISLSKDFSKACVFSDTQIGLLDLSKFHLYASGAGAHICQTNGHTHCHIHCRTHLSLSLSHSLSLSLSHTHTHTHTRIHTLRTCKCAPGSLPLIFSTPRLPSHTRPPKTWCHTFTSSTSSTCALSPTKRPCCTTTTCSHSSSCSSCATAPGTPTSRAKTSSVGSSRSCVCVCRCVRACVWLW